MSEKVIVLTYEGLNKLENELQDLKINRRKEIAEKIKEARGQGDLSENAEYDAAKEEQAEVEARIITLENMLRKAEVIDENKLDSTKINVGNKVKILDNKENEEMLFTIVGSAEADPFAGKISNESPLGAMLLGKETGDSVSVEAPDGIVSYTILEITR